jgi:hypothetical protein
MIVKTFLKHLMLEKSIDLIFNGIMSNFSICSASRMTTIKKLNSSHMGKHVKVYGRYYGNNYYAIAEGALVGIALKEPVGSGYRTDNILITLLNDGVSADWGFYDDSRVEVMC